MRSYLNAGLVLAVAGIITVLSLSPAPTGAAPESSAFQFGRFALYFILAGALLLYFHDTPRGRMEAVLGAGAFGLLIELVQLQLPFRAFSPADVAVNMLGASVVLLDHRSTLVTSIVEKEDELIEQYLL